MAQIYKKDLVLGDKKAKIWYLGHSGWAVKTESHFLIFDYRGAGEVVIFPEELAEEKVYVFVSHNHGDHYSATVRTWVEEIPDIHYVFGWDMPETENSVSLPPHENRKIEKITVSTLRSTDMGSGFLVEVEKLKIFHAGDHANWEDNEPGISYEGEIDYIAEKAEGKIDIAFLPVTTFAGFRPKSITQGAFYAIRKLQPNFVFPMHGNGREHLYKEFAKDAAQKNFDAKILCAEKIGDSWTV